MIFLDKLKVKIKYLGSYTKTLSFVMVLKIRFRKRLKVNVKQLWEHRPEIQIYNGGEIEIGPKLHVRKNTSLLCDEGKMKIGYGVFLNNNVCITSLNKISIGDGTKIANNVVIVDHDHNYSENEKGSYKTEPVEIGKNVWIGANSVILKGVKIGDDSVIAAGSIVNRNIPGNTLYYQKKEQILTLIKRG